MVLLDAAEAMLTRGTTNPTAISATSVIDRILLPAADIHTSEYQINPFGVSD
jgi:hypothetical protein